MVKYDGMLILGQNDISWGHNVVNFSVWFLQLTVFKYLVASHVTELGSLLTEPCAVIKFSHFSSHPSTCMPYKRIMTQFAAVVVGLSFFRYNDVIMNVMASLITSLTIFYPIVYPGEDQRKHQSSASLAFVRGIHQWPVNSPHKGPVTRKMFPFDDVVMHWTHSTIFRSFSGRLYNLQCVRYGDTAVLHKAKFIPYCPVVLCQG